MYLFNEFLVMVIQPTYFNDFKKEMIYARRISKYNVIGLYALRIALLCQLIWNDISILEKYVWKMTY